MRFRIGPGLPFLQATDPLPNVWLFGGGGFVPEPRVKTQECVTKCSIEFRLPPMTRLAVERVPYLLHQLKDETHRGSFRLTVKFGFSSLLLRHHDPVDSR